MSESKSALLDHVSLSPHYQRSIRIDIDFDKSDALDGYVKQPTAIGVLETMARQIRETKQRAFTWTGPFGGGKSSLALLVSALASSDEALRRKANGILADAGVDAALSVFGGSDRWCCLPVTGRRASVGELIEEALSTHATRPGRRSSSKDLIKRIEGVANQSGCGVILILDELGKMLEWMAAEGQDIYFLQELAERFARSKYPLIVIGILHQGFDQYAARLGNSARDEWSKVQGRFVDLPFVSASDEVISLVSKAIRAQYPHPEGNELAKFVFEELKSRRPNLSSTVLEDLQNSWPLHPVVTALLGPASRKRYGQNERSLFGFIGSSEPSGFKDFLSHVSFDPRTAYTPADYWNYLKANFEPQILSSSDSHRWSLSVNALERAEARFSQDHLNVLKTISLLELFKDGSGLLATESLLATCTTQSNQSLLKILEELSKASVVIYRKHLGAWALYAGSDFDIEEALAEAVGRSDAIPYEIFSKVVDSNPVVAKRHYFEKGCLRWFSKTVMPLSMIEQESAPIIEDGSSGVFCLVLPDQSDEKRKSQKSRVSELAAKFRADEKLRAKGVVLGLAKASSNDLMIASARELAALLEILRATPELESDPVGRREVLGRIEVSRSALTDALDHALRDADWYFGAEGQLKFVRNVGLASLASTIAEKMFPLCPAIDNELLNRQSLSSPATKARKDLCYRMLEYGAMPNLGYEAMSADAGLYHSILKDRIHRVDGEVGRFVCDREDKNLGPLWLAADKLLEDCGDDGITLDRLHQCWEQEPYGLRSGVGSLLSFAYLLSGQDRYALYLDGMFVPKLSEIHIDELLHDPSRVSLKLIRVEGGEAVLLNELAQRFALEREDLFEASPLETARALVARVMRLPAWTRRTRKLSAASTVIRGLLAKASDPYALLFRDLPATLGTNNASELADMMSRAVLEMEQALALELESIWEAVGVALGVQSNNLCALNARASNVVGTSGDARLNGFIVHLRTFSATHEQLLALVTAGAGRSERDLTDMDLQTAKNQLLSWAVEFKKLELFAAFNGRDQGQILVNVGIGLDGGHANVVRQFSISLTQDLVAKSASERLLKLLEANGLDGEVALAALAKASIALSKEIA
jgi:hypothetical protein